MNPVRKSKKQYLKKSKRGEISKRVKIHFIGIGGIGVSALANYYLQKNNIISGSDLSESEITKALKKQGAKICIGQQRTQNITKDLDLVVYSPAVQKDNPELKEAKELQVANSKLQVLSYPEALGQLTKQYFTIAVSGTHGKSTTTAMIGLLLTKAGLDPTVIIGTKLKEFGNKNCRVGESPLRSPYGGHEVNKYLVIEADEHLASFLNYWPKIIVLTTIEADHLDYYKNLKNIIKAFREYIGHLSKDDWLVINKDDKGILKLKTQSSKVKFKVKGYSLKQKEAKRIRKILQIPGEHNVSNALAVLTVARILKIPDRVSFQSLSEYRGAWRRFERKQLTINNKQLTVISDYGHHPTEILVTLKAAREEFPKKKIWCIFQPHQYQRTSYLFKDFLKVFRQTKDSGFLNKLIITDIYDVAGREEKNISRKINSENMVNQVKRKGVIYLPKERLVNYVKNNIAYLDILIVMGAGDIYRIIPDF